MEWAIFADVSFFFILPHLHTTLETVSIMLDMNWKQNVEELVACYFEKHFLSKTTKFRPHQNYVWGISFDKGTFFLRLTKNI